MSTITVLRPHDTSPSATAAHSQLGRVLHALGDGLDRAAAARRHRWQVRQTRRELQALDDRTLADIGVHRGNIADIAEQLAPPFVGNPTDLGPRL